MANTVQIVVSLLYGKINVACNNLSQKQMTRSAAGLELKRCDKFAKLTMSIVGVMKL